MLPGQHHRMSTTPLLVLPVLLPPKVPHLRVETDAPGYDVGPAKGRGRLLAPLWQSSVDAKLGQQQTPTEARSEADGCQLLILGLFQLLILNICIILAGL